MQIYCTTRSCTLHNQIYGTQNWAFSWMYSRSLRSCRLMGGFINSPLPPVPTPAPRATRPLRSADVTPFHRYYEPRRHRLAFSRLPGGCRLYGRLAPSISRWGEDGFSSCSACPCHRAIPNHPAGVLRRISQSAALHAAFAPNQGARPPELFFVEATFGFTDVMAR
jgi:hypothetical protein